MNQMKGSDFVKQNLLNQADSLLGFFSNLVFNIFFPIVLGAVLFGELSVILGLAYMLVSLFNDGFDNTAVKHISHYFSRKEFPKVSSVFNYLFKMKLIFFILLTILLILFSSALSNIYSVSALGILIVASLVILRPMDSYLREVFVSIRKAQYSMIASLIFSIFFITFPAVFYFMGFGINGVLIGIIFSFVIMLFILFLFVLKERYLYEKNFSADFKEIFADILRFSLISFSKFGLFTQWGILLLIGLFLPVENVAFFKIAVAWVAVVTTLIPVSRRVIFAGFVGVNAENNAKRFDAFVSKTIRYSMMIVIPATAGLFLTGPSLINLIYGSEYKSAGIVLSLISWAIIPIFLIDIFSSILIAKNKTKELSLISFIGIIFGLIITTMLTYSFDLIGTSIAYLVFFIFCFLLVCFLISKHVSSDIIIKSVKSSIKPFISSIMMSIFILAFIEFTTTIIYTLILIAIAIIVYFVSLMLIDGIDVNDFILVKNIFRK